MTNLQKHDGMFTGVLHEEFLEVVAGGREDDLVALEAASVAGEGDVSEGLGVEQPLEHREHVCLVLGPAEAEHLRQRVQPRDGQLRQQTENNKHNQSLVAGDIFRGFTLI